MFVVAERFFDSDPAPSAWVVDLVVKAKGRKFTTRKVVLGPHTMAGKWTLRDAESIAAYLNAQGHGIPRYKAEPCDKQEAARRE